MENNIYCVIVAQHLTSDSYVRFFNSLEKAREFYDSQVNPLVEICRSEGLTEGECWFNADTNARFNGGHSDELDAAMGGDVDTYFAIIKLQADENTTHYIAKFSQYVDQSSVEIGSLNEVVKKYEETAADNIKTFGLPEYIRGTEFEDEDGNRLEEGYNEEQDSQDFFFMMDGYEYETTRMAAIKMEE